MNPKLKEINEIIKWCDQMMDVAHRTGCIKSNHEYYHTYCKRVSSFCTANNLIDSNYAPYAILRMYWKPSSIVTLYPCEIAEIRHNLILIKHDLFKDAYEKIFISHR